MCVRLFPKTIFIIAILVTTQFSTPAEASLSHFRDSCFNGILLGGNVIARVIPRLTAQNLRLHSYIRKRWMSPNFAGEEISTTAIERFLSSLPQSAAIQYELDSSNQRIIIKKNGDSPLNQFAMRLDDFDEWTVAVGLNARRLEEEKTLLIPVEDVLSGFPLSGLTTWEGEDLDHTDPILSLRIQDLNRTLLDTNVHHILDNLLHLLNHELVQVLSGQRSLLTLSQVGFLLARLEKQLVESLAQLRLLATPLNDVRIPLSEPEMLNSVSDINGVSLSSRTNSDPGPFRWVYFPSSTYGVVFSYLGEEPDSGFSALAWAIVQNASSINQILLESIPDFLEEVRAYRIALSNFRRVPDEQFLAALNALMDICDEITEIYHPEGTDLLQFE